ncbi:hypothetical protein Bca52824_068099 [Brassica carinata]|uniref:TLC domain-containing protein n=1 Tax=Brassica carinata TaxID=52824 RepID=A0A8X7Q042_BRACI|nr:hypothetical protein Bca52824_068099 [Brassica carinata]
MDMKSYPNQPEGFVTLYLLADPFLPYTSVLAGIFLCKMSFSSIHINSYSALVKMKRIEWNNRGISTLHAIFISFMALYFVFFSDLFSDQRKLQGLMAFRSSPLSNFVLGVSVAYFLADLVKDHLIFHHCLSGAQLYTYMVLLSEVTTSEINLRWYFDTSGLKQCKAYIINGVASFLAWLVSIFITFCRYQSVVLKLNIDHQPGDRKEDIFQTNNQ